MQISHFPDDRTMKIELGDEIILESRARAQGNIDWFDRRMGWQGTEVEVQEDKKTGSNFVDMHLQRYWERDIYFCWGFAGISSSRLWKRKAILENEYRTEMI
jgi:hypothetical protein